MVYYSLLILQLQDNDDLKFGDVDDEVGVGAPLRPDVSKVNVSITLVGGLLLGSPLGTEPFLVLFFRDSSIPY